METKANLAGKEEDIGKEMDIIEEVDMVEKADAPNKGITEETRNQAVLDTSCKRSVVGIPWLEAYMKELGKYFEKEMIDLQAKG